MKLPTIASLAFLWGTKNTVAFAPHHSSPVSTFSLVPSSSSIPSTTRTHLNASNSDQNGGIDIDIHIETKASASASESTSSSSSTSTRRQWVTHSVTFASSVAVASSHPLASLADSEGSVASLVAVTNGNTSPAVLCDPSVSTFRNPSNGRIVHILGTAHISSASAEVAGQLVREMKPGAVFVELDAKRVGRAIPKPGNNNSSGDENNSSNSEPTSEQTPPISRSPVLASASTTDEAVVQESPSATSEEPTTTRTTTVTKKPFNVKEKIMNKASQAVGNGIKGMYSKLESEGFNAGEEFVVAVREGLNGGSKIILGDQDVEITLRRLTEALSKTDLKKLLAADNELEESMKSFMPEGSMSGSGSSGGGSGDPTGMSKEQLSYFVETVKAKENVRLVMGNLQRISPELYNALVRERDIYMANGIDKLNQFDSMVAVMGIAHVDGVESTLRERGWMEVKQMCES